MNIFQFSYQDALVSESEITHFGKELVAEIERVSRAREKKYETSYALLAAPFDDAVITYVMRIIEEKKKLKPSTFVLIGIGGSNLGTLAVHEALHGKLYNELSPGLKFYCADTVDADQLVQQLQCVEKELAAGKQVLINVVTKSGKTTETIANFELFLALLRKYYPNDYQNYVVVTTDAGSPFEAFAVDQGFTVLSMPVQIGGRYSVFTAVGLFPLGMLGIDIQEFVAGAQQIIPSCIEQNLLQNPAVLSAVIKYAYYQQCVNIHDMFVFGPHLQTIGLWYRQLLGESVGKELNKSSQKVEVGITPTVSVGTTDLHSVGQLALGGPRDKYTTFITVHRPHKNVQLPQMPEFEPFVPYIQGRKITDITNAIISGVQAAYRTHKRPFCTVILPDISPRIIGQLLQFYMIEMIYLGYLFDVNPFDQPNVEAYKKETRRVLEAS